MAVENPETKQPEKEQPQNDSKKENVEEEITKAFQTLSPEDQELFSNTQLIHTDREEDVQSQVYHVVKLQKQNEQRKKHVLHIILCLMIIGIAASLVGLLLKNQKEAERKETVSALPEESEDSNLIAVNAATFPDASFRKRILEAADRDGDASLSPEEIRSVVMLNYSGDDTIADVSGIEYLTSLQYLNLSGTKVTSLNLSGNTRLTSLVLDHTGITQLNLEGLSELKSLDIRSCTSLQSLTLPQPSAVEEVLSEGTNFECTANSEDLYTACRLRQ